MSNFNRLMYASSANFLESGVQQSAGFETTSMVLSAAGTAGVAVGCESYGIGCNELIDGFGNGFGHAVEYPLWHQSK
jgi:hypothetical protein